MTRHSTAQRTGQPTAQVTAAYGARSSMPELSASASASALAAASASTRARASALARRRASLATGGAPPTTTTIRVRDLTAILSVSLRVDGFQYDSSIMEHPEFRLSTLVVFQTRLHGGQQLESQWQLYRSFHEFQGLDAQLRQRFPVAMSALAPPPLHRRRAFLRLHRSKSFLSRRCGELNAYLAQLVGTVSMGLVRFLDPRAPLLLRCFCNFDAGFGRRWRLCRDQLAGCVLCLDHVGSRGDSLASLPSEMSAEEGEDGEGNQGRDTEYDEEEEEEEEDTQQIKQQAAYLREQQRLRPHWRASQRELRRSQSRSRATTTTDAGSEAGLPFGSSEEEDELAASRRDDRARNLTACARLSCACQHVSFRVASQALMQELARHGCHVRFAPPQDVATALYCVLFALQQHNDTDRQRFARQQERERRARDQLRAQQQRPSVTAGISGIRSSLGRRSSEVELALAQEDEAYDEDEDEDEDEEDDEDEEEPYESTGKPWRSRADKATARQLSEGVERLREALAHYGLLFVHRLAAPFREHVVDLKKKLHAFKHRAHHRVGMLELVLLCSMLDLSLTLVATDHARTVQHILPLAGLPSLRRGGRLVLTLGYVLPTEGAIHGAYVLAERETESPRPEEEDPERQLWRGLDNLDEQLAALIQEQVTRPAVAGPGPAGPDEPEPDAFEHSVAETLNRAMLDAVWNDCQHNPNLFHLFQKQAREFGKRRAPASYFVQYLEVAFGAEGACYLVDFLLHVLPEPELRFQLRRARWLRVRRRLLKRAAAPSNPKMVAIVTVTAATELKPTASGGGGG